MRYLPAGQCTGLVAAAEIVVEIGQTGRRSFAAVGCRLKAVAAVG